MFGMHGLEAHATGEVICAPGRAFLWGMIWHRLPQEQDQFPATIEKPSSWLWIICSISKTFLTQLAEKSANRAYPMPTSKEAELGLLWRWGGESNRPGQNAASPSGASQ